MDREALAKELFLRHPDIEIETILDRVELLFDGVENRCWKIPLKCQHCKEDFNFINLTTSKSPEYEMRCGCSKGRGITIEAAAKDLIKKMKDKG